MHRLPKAESSAAQEKKHLPIIPLPPLLFFPLSTSTAFGPSMLLRLPRLLSRSPRRLPPSIIAPASASDAKLLAGPIVRGSGKSGSFLAGDSAPTGSTAPPPGRRSGDLPLAIWHHTKAVVEEGTFFAIDSEFGHDRYIAALILSVLLLSLLSDNNEPAIHAF